MTQLPDIDIDLPALRDICYCAVLMTAVDQKFKREEWDVCLAVISHYWKPEFGNAKALFLETVSEVKKTIGSRFLVNAKFEEIASTLQVQELDLLLKVMERVMMADKEVVVKETDLLQRIRQKVAEHVISF